MNQFLAKIEDSRLVDVVANNPSMVVFLAGIGLCAYVVDKANRGSFSIGWDGLSVNFEK